MQNGLIKSPYDIKTGTFMSEPKKLELTIGERLAAIRIFDAFKGGLSTLSILLEDVKAFTITPEEWKAANLRKSPTDEDLAAMDPEARSKVNQTWNWDDVGSKEVTVQDPTLEYLVSAIKKKSDEGDVTLADVALITLDKKLK